MSSTRLRIGTYNVQDLFAWGSVKGRRRRKKAPEIRAACARVIRDADVDLLALQEVSSVTELESFNRHDLRGGYPHLHVFTGHSERSMHLAVLSRHPFRIVDPGTASSLTDGDTRPLVDDQGRPARFRRGFHGLEIPLREGAMTVFVTHLKSQQPLERAYGVATPSGPRGVPLPADEYRRAEARAAAARVRRELDAGRSWVAVLGDLNDHDGPDSSIAPLVHGLDLFDPLRFERPFPEDRWTARWKRHGAKRYDYVLLSPSLRNRYLADSTRVHRRPPADQASDHRLVSVDLGMDPTPPAQRRGEGELPVPGSTTST